MKKISLILIVVLAICINFTSTFAANQKKLDISEKYIKNVIMVYEANVILDEYDSKIISVIDVKTDKKSIIKTRYGIVTSYVITAEIDVERYGKHKFLMYVYTGESNKIQYLNVEEVFLMGVEDAGIVNYPKHLTKFRKYVKNNTAVAKVALELAVN